MKEKRILAGITLLFFVAMAVFTGLSRHIALSALTKVETVRSFQRVEVPADRVFTRDGRYFVQVVETEQSILGEQYVVEEAELAVLKKSPKTVTLDPGEYAWEIIVDSEKEVFAGEKVRKE